MRAWIGRVIGWPARFLFGRDVFISYARRGATEYAAQLGNRLMSTTQGLSRSISAPQRRGTARTPVPGSQWLDVAPGCGVTRIRRISRGAKHVNEARVPAGFHFRNSDQAGATLGRKVAHFVVSGQFRPIE
jgi:hypothetical protein